MAKSNKKTEAAKVLIANGWSVEDVFEVLQLEQEKTVVVERFIRDRPFQFPTRPYWSLDAIGEFKPNQNSQIGKISFQTNKTL